MPFINEASDSVFSIYLVIHRQRSVRTSFFNSEFGLSISTCSASEISRNSPFILSLFRMPLSESPSTYLIHFLINYWIPLVHFMYPAGIQTPDYKFLILNNKSFIPLFLSRYTTPLRALSRISRKGVDPRLPLPSPRRKKEQETASRKGGPEPPQHDPRRSACPWEVSPRVHARLGGRGTGDDGRGAVADPGRRCVGGLGSGSHHEQTEVPPSPSFCNSGCRFSKGATGKRVAFAVLFVSNLNSWRFSVRLRSRCEVVLCILQYLDDVQVPPNSPFVPSSAAQLGT